jgi:GTP-binding protein Era
MVFVDTPGLHQPHNKLGRILNDTTKKSLVDVNVVLVVVDVSRPPTEDDRALAKLLEGGGFFGENPPAPLLLCMNKMDVLKAIDVQPNYDAYLHLFKTEKHMLTSFTKGHNAQKLLEMLLEVLPEGPPLYGDDEITDQSMRSLASELVREKALRLTRQEVPHAIATYVEEWEEEPDRDLVRIAVVFIVERDGQKAIIIGKQGAMLKKIGTESRQEIEAILGRKVFLEIFVKVKTDWRENPRILSELDLT